MKNTSKSKAEVRSGDDAWRTLQTLPSGGRVSVLRGSKDPREKEPTDIIARMEAAQQRFNPFPSLLVSAENERRDAETLSALQFALAPEFDEASEHENDLRHESLMADESEYGQVCNLKGDQQ